MAHKKMSSKIISGIIISALIGCMFTITALADVRPDVNTVIRRGTRTTTHAYTEYLASGDDEYDEADMADPNKVTVGVKGYAWKDVPVSGDVVETDGYTHNKASDDDPDSPEMEFIDGEGVRQMEIYVEDMNKLLYSANLIFEDYFAIHLQERADNILIRATDEDIDRLAQGMMDGTVNVH